MRSLERAFAAASAASAVIVVGGVGSTPAATFPSAAAAQAGAAAATIDSVSPPQQQLLGYAGGGEGPSMMTDTSTVHGSSSGHHAMPRPLMSSGGRQGSTLFSSSVTQGFWPNNDVSMRSYDGAELGGSEDGGGGDVGGGSINPRRLGPFSSRDSADHRAMLSVAYGTQSSSQLGQPGFSLHASASFGAILASAALPPSSPQQRGRLSGARHHHMAASGHHPFIDKKSAELRTHALIKMSVAPSDQVTMPVVIDTSCMHADP